MGGLCRLMPWEFLYDYLVDYYRKSLLRMKVEGPLRPVGEVGPVGEGGLVAERGFIGEERPAG